jgi:hypothetical protein
MEGQEAKNKFWDLYREIQRPLEAGRKAEALDAVCAAFKHCIDGLGSNDRYFIGGVIDLQHLLANYDTQSQML